MTESTPSPEQTTLQRAAELELQFSLHLRDSIYAEMMTTARWMMTTLVVLNSGGAFALLTAEINRAPTVSAGAFYLGGIMLGLLTGLMNVQLAQKMLPKLGQFGGYWLSVATDGIRDEEVEVGYGDSIKKTGWRGVLGRIAGYGSLGCFLAGCVTIGISLP